MGTTNLKPTPLFGIGTFGKSKNVSSQQRTNLYTEIDEDPETTTIHLYPTPGTVLSLSLGSEPSRGFRAIGNFRYIVNRNSLYKVANDNTFTNVGTLLTSTGRVSMSDNGTQLIIVDGTAGAPGGGYIYNMNTLVFAQITDVDFPGGDTVDFLNGYFIVNKPNSGEFWISALYDGLVWDVLDFATAESNPDNLVAIQVNNGQLILYGDKTTEFWGDSGALDFPFARIGAAAVEWGLAARWSLVKFIDAVIFLGKNRLGAVQVFVMDQGVAVPVSTPNIDYLFSQYAKTSSVADATGLSYMISGHPMYQINFPSINVSWCFDGKSKEWHQLKTGTGRHVAEIQYNHLDTSYVTSYLDGSLYRFDDTVYSDNGQLISREIVTRHQLTGNWSVLDELWLEMEAGVGLTIGQGSDPVIMMQYSKDGGHVWSQEIWVPFGKIGEYSRRAVWRKLGRARDWLFRFVITDPVKTVFVAAWGRGGQ